VLGYERARFHGVAVEPGVRLGNQHHRGGVAVLCFLKSFVEPGDDGVTAIGPFDRNLERLCKDCCRSPGYSWLRT